MHGCSSQNARYPLISFFLGTEIPLGKKKKKSDMKHLTDTAEKGPDERQLVLISTEESSMN